MKKTTVRQMSQKFGVSDDQLMKWIADEILKQRRIKKPPPDFLVGRGEELMKEMATRKKANTIVANVYGTSLKDVLEGLNARSLYRRVYLNDAIDKLKKFYS